MWSTPSSWKPGLKTEPKKLPPERVEALLTAAERIQDKFDSDPELKSLYGDAFIQLLDTAVKHSENKA
jgi:hypothetical protein